MTTTAPVTTQPTTHDIDDPHTLAGEHARLMRDVARRAAPVLALLDARAWPYAELGTLTAFLRTAVLRQISDEETRLYPHDSTVPPFTELGAGHVRVHGLTAQLEKAHAESCSRGHLHTLVDQLLTTLRRHLADEEAVLATRPAGETVVPSVAALATADQAWLPDDGGGAVVIDLDNMPADQAAELCIERLLRLQPGETAELHGRNDQVLRSVRHWLHDFDAGMFGLSHAMAGQDYLLRVTRRRADAAAGIGYPG